MRPFLLLGLFALTLGAVTTADAQGRRRAPEARHTTVAVDRRPQPIPRRDWQQARYHRGRAAVHADLQRQRRDHEEIVRISRRWRQASYHRDPHAKRHLKLRANRWIDREVAEARTRPNGGRYALRLRALQRELNARHRRYDRAYHYGYDYGDSYGHGYRPANKERVLDELVMLSAAELRRAEVRAGRHMHLAFSVR